MLVFTICSNNYLAQAKVLGDSWLEFHPETSFKIILVDELSEQVDYGFFKQIQIIPVKELGIPHFDELVARYSIVELNTAVKADAFLYLFEQTGEDCIAYIDPDILITSRNTELLEWMKEYNYALTPHMLEGVDDGKVPTDHQILRSGVFNLGFIALADIDKVRPFLEWWRDRLRYYGFTDYSRNMFYDQLWIDYLPCLYDNYYIIKHRGYNVANWNLHERSLGWDEALNNYRVNGTYELRFFHFSGYNFKKPEQINKYNTRFTFDSRPDIAPIFRHYHQLLIDAKMPELAKVPCVYFEQHKVYKQEAAQREWNALPLKIKLAKTAKKLAAKFIYNN